MAAKNQLKIIAKNAKIRLCTGYWDKIAIQRADAINQAIALGRDPMCVVTYFRERTKRDIKVMESHVDRLDEDLYNKLKKMWDEGVPIANPAAIVGDMKFAARLVDSDRQRYILKMIAKYNDFRKRYDHEKELLEGITLMDFDSIDPMQYIKRKPQL